ncbi:hypothetical protein WR25_04362 [Diploscapter pachys]|uniref:Uncharacterized protein n=1 Tax=Diploscapter pachys TaxID=2018661 RepID=A0A2A2LYZ6_9BILA|nr:hypothetical protein WR25_04362 [Diploscapter pachys]
MCFGNIENLEILCDKFRRPNQLGKSNDRSYEIFEAYLQQVQQQVLQQVQHLKIFLSEKTEISKQTGNICNSSRVCNNSSSRAYSNNIHIHSSSPSILLRIPIECQLRLLLFPSKLLLSIVPNPSTQLRSVRPN